MLRTIRNVRQLFLRLAPNKRPIPRGLVFLNLFRLSEPHGKRALALLEACRRYCFGTFKQQLDYTAMRAAAQHMADKLLLRKVFDVTLARLTAIPRFETRRRVHPEQSARTPFDMYA